MQERIYADEDGARKEEIALLKGLDEHGFRYVKSSSSSAIAAHASSQFSLKAWRTLHSP